jgi:hypothetical protein
VRLWSCCQKDFFGGAVFGNKYFVFLNICSELKSGWLVTYENRNFYDRIETHSGSQVDALAKMWLYLKKESLLTSPTREGSEKEK